MWDFLKKAGQQILQAGVAYAENRAFILSLLQGSEQDAHHRLRERMHALDDAGYNAFKATLSGMIGQAAQHLQQVQASGGLGAWGNSFEDRMAQAVAEFNTGDRSASSGAIQQAQQVLNGLQIVMQYGEHYRAERNAQPPQHAAPPQALHASKPQPKRAQPDIAELERLVDQLAETGQMPEGLLEKMTALDDPDLMERLYAKMQAIGGEEVSSGPQINIKDYYVAGSGKYSLWWPLSPHLNLPVAFDELDRETQFHVLWGETTRRNAEALALRNAGKLDDADAVLRETLERADQLDVPLLKAIAYEGLLSVAEKRGDHRAAERYLKLAEQEQQRQMDRMG